MKTATSISIRAFLLLTIFLTNTVIGFACAASHLFNTTDAHCSENVLCHHHKKGHCCTDNVVTFEQSAKAVVTYSSHFNITPVNFIKTNAGFNINLARISNVKVFKPFLQIAWSPPDHQAFIQSFLI